jgi:hypothetical protein
MALRPYTQLLNTSTWTTYASDFDPATTSHEELFATYVLVHGDRMALTARGHAGGAPQRGVLV